SVRHFRNERRLDWAPLVLMVVAICAEPQIKAFHKLTTSNISLAIVTFLGMLASIWVFFRLRRKNRFLYGSIEVVFGIFLIGKFVFISRAHSFSQFDYFSL